MNFKYVTGVIDNKEFPYYTYEQIRFILNDASKKVSLKTYEYSYYLKRLENDVTMEDLVAYTEEEVVEECYNMNSSDITRLSVDKQIGILTGGTYTERIESPCICYSVVSNSQIYYCIRYYAD